MLMRRHLRKGSVVVVFLLLGVGAWALISGGGARCSRPVGGVLVVACSGLGAVARRQLGRSFSVRPEARRLVTHGLYARIPHPLYVFADLALLGVVLVVAWRWLVFVWAGLVVVQAFVAAGEARRLEESFGDGYRAYRSRTWW